MSMNYKEEIIEAIEDFLKEDDWNFAPADERDIIRFNLSISTKMKNVNYLIRALETGFIVNCVFPIGGDEDSAAALTEFVNRANYGLNYGNFEMDPSDNEVRFRMPHYCGDAVPTAEQIRHAIYVSAAMAKRYSDAMLSVIFGMASAEDAIAKAEED